MPTIRQARAWVRLAAQELLAYRNVVAVAAGRKERAGRVVGDGWCVRVHVDHKGIRKSNDAIPRRLRPPAGKSWMGVIETDVIATGRPHLHANVEPGRRVFVGRRTWGHYTAAPSGGRPLLAHTRLDRSARPRPFR